MTKQTTPWILVPMVLLGATALIAQESNFTGDGDGVTWEEAANWDNGVPSFVNANIGDTFSVTLSSNQVVNELDVVGDINSGMAEVNHSAGALGIVGWMKIGVSSGNTGTYNMTGNSQVNYGVLFMAANGGTGTLDLADSAQLVGGGVNLGLNPDATVTVNIADNAFMSVSDFNLGNGTVNQTGGTMTASSWIAIAKDGASGSYNISGGTLNQEFFADDFISVGEAQAGALNISGDAEVNAAANGMIVGRFDGGDGTVEITGSNASVSVTDLRVGIDDMGMDTTAVGTLSWIADENGVTPIVSDDNTEFGVEDSTLLLDFTADSNFGSYGNGSKEVEILLVDNSAAVQGAFAGLGEGASVSIGGSKTGTLSYQGGSDGFDISVTVTMGDEVLLGDVNCDGVVNLLDIAPFVDLISTSGFSDKADINMDGFVNLLDVAPFVQILSDG